MNAIQEIHPASPEFANFLKAELFSDAEVEAVLSCLQSTYLDEAEYENSDNLRIARLDRADDVAHYSKVQSEGCCGAFDTVIQVEGRFILVGFNFGH